MPTLFVWKNVPVFFSIRGETWLQTCAWRSTPYRLTHPLPPILETGLNTCMHTQCSCFSRIEILHSCWSVYNIVLPFCRKNRDIFSHKNWKSWHGKFSADLEQLEKLLRNRHNVAGLHGPFQLWYLQNHIMQKALKCGTWISRWHRGCSNTGKLHKISKWFIIVPGSQGLQSGGKYHEELRWALIWCSLKSPTIQNPNLTRSIGCTSGLCYYYMSEDKFEILCHCEQPWTTNAAHDFQSWKLPSLGLPLEGLAIFPPQVLRWDQVCWRHRWTQFLHPL